MQEASVYSEAVGTVGTGTWSIRGWDVIKKIPGHVITSPCLSIGGVGWKITITPGGQPEVKENKLAIPPVEAKPANEFCLFLYADTPVVARALITFNVITNLDHTVQQRQFIPNEGWGWNNLVSLVAALKQPDMPPNNELRIQLKVWCSSHVHDLCVPAPMPKSYEQQLIQDMDGLLASGRKTDVSFLVHGQEFRAHRLILEIRSPVFEAMFKHGMNESLSGEVVIDGIRISVFRSLLKFIYTGNCALVESEDEDKLVHEKKDLQRKHVNPEFVSELLLAADQYQIAALVEYCGNYLIRSLHLDNVLMLYQIADKCKAMDLRSACLNLITRDKRTLGTVLDHSAIKSLTAEQFRAILHASADPGMAKHRLLLTDDLVILEPPSTPPHRKRPKLTPNVEPLKTATVLSAL